LRVESVSLQWLVDRSVTVKPGSAVGIETERGMSHSLWKGRGTHYIARLIQLLCGEEHHDRSHRPMKILCVDKRRARETRGSDVSIWDELKLPFNRSVPLQLISLFLQSLSQSAHTSLFPYLPSSLGDPP
jgi:hypothetical protein